MSKTVKLKNDSNENLAFAGFPMIGPNQTFEATEQDAEILLRNSNVKLAEPAKEEKSERKVRGVE